ncbi:hypothetical protein GCM10027423_06650 [Spirosoma arcticum]
MTGIWDASHMPARAEALLTVNGKLRVSSATADIGTGTYTTMTQIAAETLGMPIEDVVFRLGDTDMPLAPIQGGFDGGVAVKAVCDALGDKLLAMAKKMPGSPVAKVKRDDVLFSDGFIQLKVDPSMRVSLLTIVEQNGGRAVSETATSIPNMLKNKQ